MKFCHMHVHIYYVYTCIFVCHQELSLKEDMMKKMENSLENYKRKFAVMRHQQGLLYLDYLKDKKVRKKS